ncbi:hypothetical protein [Lysinibacillus odysseyi]|uniref:hypothetical protein n=1 Tax=Lysinibacillus odysseyi TaxID=202611 RepID=UPI0005616F4F|nr:hypothetical protein [Lysinibacillus odysseyi]
MLTYYFYNQNTDAKGNHQVHAPDCTYSPEVEDTIALGMHANSKEAIQYAEAFTGKTNFDSCACCWTKLEKSQA